MHKTLKSTALYLALISSPLLGQQKGQAQEINPGSNNLGYFVTGVNTGSRTRLDLYKMNTGGVATNVYEDIFPDSNLGTFSASDYTVNTKTGKIYFLEAPSGSATRRVRIWDIETEKFEGFTDIQGLPSSGSPLFIEYPTNLNNLVKKTCVSNSDSCENNDTTKVTLGADGNSSIAVIDDEGLSVGGKSIVRRKLNAAGEEELHIGENSLVTVESNGVQKLYATDANGKKIPINITEGSDLQINGVSVQGQLDKHTTDINKNSKAIDSLEDDVNALGSGVAGAAALSAALSALPTVSDDAPFSCGVGTGGYSSRYAMGVGCAARLNERLSFNAGGSVLFGGASNYGSGSLDTVAGRAGFVFKLGQLAPSGTGDRNAQLQSKLKQVENHNAEMAYQLESLQQRLNQLEALATGLQQQKAVATTLVP
ncbi:YadA-like family protein [Synechococcus sp. MIT S9451]|uniref:YadA C-terminal domain-containing protein n=1 Tax=Synechococcus sp. MIT S9451 TaxID=3082543 RepID=UPI0039B5C153